MKIFGMANQPFSPVNIINEVYQKTGVYENYTLTTMALFDTDTSSLMFSNDEMKLSKNLDSLAD
jgi:hypothetical protein